MKPTSKHWSDHIMAGLAAPVLPAKSFH